MYEVQTAYMAGCEGQGFAQRDLRWNTLRADDPTPPWYYRVHMLLRGVGAHPPHPLFTALARLDPILQRARPMPRRQRQPRRRKKPLRGGAPRRGYSIHAHTAAIDTGVREASADSVLTVPERAWTAPEFQYTAVATPLPHSIVDVMQDGHIHQDTSLLYYAGHDMTVESPEI